MLDDERMTIDERRKYLKGMARRYRVANQGQRGQLLTEMETVTELHRKSLLRLLHAPTLERQPRAGQRGRAYGAAVEDVIRVVWESLDYVCAERLTPTLLHSAQQLARFGEVRLSTAVETQLDQISEATVQRLLQRFQQDTPRLPRRGPESANRVARAIPMGRLPWDLTAPGSFEVDLVHHAGSSASGEYVHTLQLIDVATGWSERVAVLGRSARAMEHGFRHILTRLPFAIQHLHPDNGPEFLNEHLQRFFGKAIVGLRWSRSRPYHKNDNRFVEQKNFTLVRAYVGHERLDTAGQCAALTALYDQMWVYYNLFQPVLHLVKKEVVGEHRIKRRWDEAKTPYHRLLETGVVSAEQQGKLAELHARTNPRQLRREIRRGLECLWDPAIVAGEVAAGTITS